MRTAATLALALFAAVAAATGSWCLGMEGLGPIRAGMPLEEVLRRADFSGMERKRSAEQCWYLRHGEDFELMIIGGRVARIEINGTSKLRTFSGAGIGSSEDELRAIYGARLDVQPHKYDEKGHTITFRSTDGTHGLRFETSSGKVTTMQSGTWEHLHYVERCG